jgi:hypothetical protein
MENLANCARAGDLVLLQTRPVGKDELRPPHDQYHGQPERSASTYAKVIVDTAVSLTGGRGQNPFFPTKVQIAIQTGFEVLRHMEAYVTIPNIHRLLLNEADANAAIETLMNKGDQRSHELIVAAAMIFRSAAGQQRCPRNAQHASILHQPEIAEVSARTATFQLVRSNKNVQSIPQVRSGACINTIPAPYFFRLSRLKTNRRAGEGQSYRPLRGRRTGNHHRRGIRVRGPPGGGDHSRSARDHGSRDPGLHLPSRLSRPTLRGRAHAELEQRIDLHLRQS